MQLNFSYQNLRYYFKKNQTVMVSLLIFFFVGIVIGIFVALSSDSYISILSTSDKNFYGFVKGDASYYLLVKNLIIKNVAFEFIIFLLNLNYYSGLLSYGFISYQSALMYLSMIAVVSEFGFGGVLSVLFISLPLNLILFFINLLFTLICINRSKLALKSKSFTFGFDKNFIAKILLIILTVIVFSCIVGFIFFLILKSRNFILF